MDAQSPTSSSAHHLSQRPVEMSEKGTRLSPSQFSSDVKSPSTAGPSNFPSLSPVSSRSPRSFAESPCPLILQSRARPRGQLVQSVIQPWIPLIIYAITSLGFVVAISLYRPELFNFLDALSAWLKADEQFGHAVLFLLIFITTFPPVPLYSTLIVLAGYTFGTFVGAVISYFAALTGGVVVFVISRAFLRDCISRWLASTVTLRRVFLAIERRPQILFLVRVAPYPYNALSAILSASSTLTLKTYTICTALSLFKVVIHTSLGASIHSFRDFHTGQDGATTEDVDANTMSRVWTVIGVFLCIAILIYLSVVARRAVDEELDDGVPADPEETVGFLSPTDLESTGRPMAQSPHRISASLPHHNHHQVSNDAQWT